MRRKVLFSLLLGVFLMSGIAVADGFYVVGGGGVGTKITSLPFPINAPGFYYLAKDLDYSGSADGIACNVDDVTIDLMGFRIRNTGSGWAGINLNSHKNVEIRNGSFSGWNVAIIDGYGGSHNRAFNIRVKDCNYGIEFDGVSNLIKGCTSETVVTGLYCSGGVVSGNAVANNTYGISAEGTISGNTTTNCSSYGIYCRGPSTIIHNTVVTTGVTQIGIGVLTSEPVLVMQNTASGSGNRLSAGAGTINISNAGF